jgi:hypothetical protein
MRSVTFQSLVRGRDIIIRQACVRQAKFISAALARPRYFASNPPICYFLCFSFCVEDCQRGYDGGICAPASAKSLGLCPWIFSDAGISESFLASKCRICKCIGGVPGRVAEARGEDFAGGRGSQFSGKRNAESHAIYWRCSNSTQRKYRDRHGHNRAGERPKCS